MRVVFLLFAAARELADASEVSLELDEGCCVSAALDALCLRHPALGPLRPQLQLAVNHRYAPSGQLLVEGDEVAVIPPISGG